MCILTQMNTHAAQSVKHTHMHSWSRHDFVHTHSLNTQKRTQASPITTQGYFPPQRLMLCQCASCRPRLACVDALLLWQAHWNWQHDLCSSTNMPGTINYHGMAWKRLGMPVIVCFTLLGWVATSSTSHSRALCLFADDDCHFIHLPLNEIGS